MATLMKNQELRRDSFGKILNIRESQRKDGSYVYRWSENGKRQQFYANSLFELRQKEFEKFQDIDMVKSVERTTLNDYYLDWLTIKKVRDRTYSNYKYIYEKHIQGSLGLKDITTIKRSEILSFYLSLMSKEYNNVKNKTGGMSQSSVENINQLLHQIFAYAKGDLVIPNNPCDDAMKAINSRGTAEKTVHRLTYEEEKALGEYLNNSKYSKKWRPIFSVLLDTGMRVSELSGLRWENVSFEHNYIKIEQAVTYGKLKESNCGHIIGDPKNNNAFRKIFMTENVKRILLEQRENMNKTKSIAKNSDYSNYVFLNDNGTPYYARLIDKGLERILADYNKNADKEGFVPIRKFTPHALRHTFASKFYSKTHNWKALQLVLGDKDLETVMSRYVEFLEDEYQDTFSEYTDSAVSYI